jgi:hypothetical protein
MVLLMLQWNDLSARWISFTLPMTVALGNGPDYACIYHQGRHRFSELGNEPFPELIDFSTMQTQKWGPLHLKVTQAATLLGSNVSSLATFPLPPCSLNHYKSDSIRIRPQLL